MSALLVICWRGPRMTDKRRCSNRKSQLLNFINLHYAFAPTFKLKNVSNTICKYPNGAAIQVIAVRFAKPILALSQGDFET